ncbi:unnamed protein product, partial [Polarella glacialis]
MALRFREVEALASRALRPWLANAARRPLPRGSPASMPQAASLALAHRTPALSSFSAPAPPTTGEGAAEVYPGPPLEDPSAGGTLGAAEFLEQRQDGSLMPVAPPQLSEQLHTLQQRLQQLQEVQLQLVHQLQQLQLLHEQTKHVQQNGLRNMPLLEQQIQQTGTELRPQRAVLRTSDAAAPELRAPLPSQSQSERAVQPEVLSESELQKESRRAGRETISDRGSISAESEEPEPLSALSAAISSHFVLVRHGARPLDEAAAHELWDAVLRTGGVLGGDSAETYRAASAASFSNSERAARAQAILRLSGRELCDLLFVLGKCRKFPRHTEVAEEVARALCSDPQAYSEELQLWPQTLPLVAEYLVWHLTDQLLMAAFLERVLAPFWRAHPASVQAALLPHHATAVSAACARCGKALPQEVLETVRSAMCSWATDNIPRLGARGTAGLALALSRVGPGLAGEEANARLLAALVRRAGQLLDEGEERPPFRPDWLGMFLSALARARCRDESETLLRLLAAHLLPGRDGKSQTLAGEVQNIALAAHAALKLDLYSSRLVSLQSLASRGEKVFSGSGALTTPTPLAALAPMIAADAFVGAPGARSACLLAHAYGAALLLLPQPPVPPDERSLAEVYEGTLQKLFSASLSLPARNIRVRFQLLSAVQCWWFALTERSEMGSPRISGNRSSSVASSLASLRTVQKVVSAVASASSGPVLPPIGPEESLGDHELISTKSHEEVAQALPRALRSPVAKMEDFVFPFWLDIVLPPGSSGHGGSSGVPGRREQGNMT